MGLCKCPKKKVTNLFCFEHRVNVCEHCLVSNHPKCVVQSYLQWLQDSDYDPNCRLCGKNLGEESAGECVRLTCYDVFHWRCLDNYTRRLPANTAPAGYTCPACKQGIFPNSNAVSPVATALRDLLATVNWARAGLGLPLIEEMSRPGGAADGAEATREATHIPAEVSAPPPYTAMPQQGFAQQIQTGIANSNLSQAASTSQHSVVNVSDTAAYSRATDKPDGFLELSKQWNSVMATGTQDHDDDKYRRRPAMQWFSRWFKSRTGGPQKRDPNANMKRILVVLMLSMIAFITLIIIFMRLGRASADNDPFLDPMANPNIRVQDS